MPITYDYFTLFYVIFLERGGVQYVIARVDKVLCFVHVLILIYVSMFFCVFLFLSCLTKIGLYCSYYSDC